MSADVVEWKEKWLPTQASGGAVDSSHIMDQNAATQQLDLLFQRIRFRTTSRQRLSVSFAMDQTRCWNYQRADSVGHRCSLRKLMTLQSLESAADDALA